MRFFSPYPVTYTLNKDADSQPQLFCEDQTAIAHNHAHSLLAFHHLYWLNSSFDPTLPIFPYPFLSLMDWKHSYSVCWVLCVSGSRHQHSAFVMLWLTNKSGSHTVPEVTTFLLQYYIFRDVLIYQTWKMLPIRMYSAYEGTGAPTYCVVKMRWIELWQWEPEKRPPFWKANHHIIHLRKLTVQQITQWHIATELCAGTWVSTTCRVNLLSLGQILTQERAIIC